MADLTVTGPGSGNAGNDQGDEIVCWVTPNSAGISSNRDGVRVIANIGPNTQTLSMNDLVTTTRPVDQIDLVCDLKGASGSKDVQRGQVTQASIIALELANAATQP
jgi:hypothetical protein